MQANEDLVARATKLLSGIKSGNKDAVSAFEELCLAQYVSDSPACYRCLPVTLETAFNGGPVTVSTMIDDAQKEFTVFVNKAADTFDKIPVDETDGSGKPIVFVVVIEPHKVFKRVGDNLVIERSAVNTEVIIGTAFSVQNLDGNKLILRTPALRYIPLDAVYIADGLGMPKRGDLDHRGDLKVHISTGLLSMTAGLLWEVSGFVRTCWNRLASDSVLLRLDEATENEQT